MRILLALLLCLPPPLGCAGEAMPVPDGFVLQHLEPTDGAIARPQDWFYTSQATPSGWAWSLSKEDPANGSYKTGMRIQLLAGVEKGTGQGREAFALSYLQQKQSALHIVSQCPKTDAGDFFRQCLEVIETINVNNSPTLFRIVYSVLWGKELDMVVVTTFGAPPESWEDARPALDAMASFVLIGPAFGRETKAVLGE